MLGLPYVPQRSDGWEVQVDWGNKTQWVNNAWSGIQSMLWKIRAHTRMASVGCSKGSYHSVEEVEVVVVEVEAWMMGTLTGAHYGKDFEENGAGSTREKMVQSSQNQLGGALKTCAQKSECNVLY